MTLSVIIPAFNAEQNLSVLLNSLSNQTYRDFEVLIIDDCSDDNTSAESGLFPFKYIRLNKNRGPAFCRNIGAKNAKGDILVFTDSDCKVDRNWLKNIHSQFTLNNLDAIMGKLVILPSTFIGDSISALGFPAGGSVGFDKIWKVDKNGFTDSLSSCNCAINKNVFWEVGGFDESFPYAGGEDSFLSYNLIRLGYRIKYCSDIIAYHEARDSLKDFVKWQFKRGISSYIFATKVTQKTSYLSLRVWSTGNVIRNSIKDKKMPLIFILLCISVLIQTMGAFYGRLDRK